MSVEFVRVPPSLVSVRPARAQNGKQECDSTNVTNLQTVLRSLSRLRVNVFSNV